MGAGHNHALYVHEHSLVHRLAPQAKVLAAFSIVAAIAITPRETIWAFASYVAMIGALVVGSRVRLTFVLWRLLAVTPFVLFAFAIPFIASGQQTEVWGVVVSVEGLWGAWNILAKATLGASITILLTATTEVPDIIRGLGVLRVPAVLTAIASFMIRYLELIGDELGRMRVAMTSRGYDPRWLYQAKPIASSAGALFVRSYERGERVHAAMVARGFGGEMPELHEERSTPGEWSLVFATVVVFVTIAVLALVTP